MKQTEIRKIKKGEFFKLKDSETAPVWVRQAYNRTTGLYDAFKYDDINHWRGFTKHTKVYIDFIF